MLGDPEFAVFERWFQSVITLAGQREQLESDLFLTRAAELRTEWDAFSESHSVQAWGAALQKRIERRFDLVDAGEEYAQAGQEAAMLAMLLPDDPLLLGPALKRSIERLSHHLTEAGAVAAFAALLRRLKQLASASGDPELSAWVQQVIGLLPD